jgi:hypothetical protein
VGKSGAEDPASVLPNLYRLSLAMRLGKFEEKADFPGGKKGLEAVSL